MRGVRRRRKPIESIQARTLRETLAQSAELKAIREQTTLTNGRVTKLEDIVRPIVAVYKHALSLWGIAMVIAPLLLGELVKAVVQHLWP